MSVVFESVPLSPISTGYICLLSPGSILPSVLSAAKRTLRVPTESDLRWLVLVVAAGSSGGESGGIDPALFGGVSLIGVESGRRCPCMPCVGVSSWNGPCTFASWLKLLSRVTLPVGES